MKNSHSNPAPRRPHANKALALTLMALACGAQAEPSSTDGATAQPAGASRRLPGQATEAAETAPASRRPEDADTPGRAENERRAPPGEPPANPEDYEFYPDPNRATRLPPVNPPPVKPYDPEEFKPEPGRWSKPYDPSEFIPVPDRWRLTRDLGLLQENWLDPYNRNLYKADRPFYEDWFFSVNLTSDTVVEPRRLPTPVSPQVGSQPGALDTFGAFDQFLFNQNFITSLVIYQGNTVFRPPNYELRITPVFNINYTEVDEYRLINIDPRRGDTRTDGFAGMQELFLDYHIHNVSPRYDFDSIRFGIQPFSSDFRGFLFQDSQLGVRLFGTRDNNLWQYNLAWFRRLEKDTNSGLNSLTQTPRDDDVFAANLYRQDFPVRGFTSQVTAIYNRNREGDNPFYYDKNGFLNRPASLGMEASRNYDVVYLGYNGDGHFGPVSLTSSFYYAVGSENRSAFADRPTNISAFFLAGEGSVDADWARFRVSALYASGDQDPYDSKEEGFDAIFENPQFAGSDTNFWIRQSVPLIGGTVGNVFLSTRNGVLANLRSSKEQGQSNFTNPGVQLYGVGTDLDLMPELRLSFNFNKMLFANTAPLDVLRNQGRISPDIGWDLSTAAIYRPFFTQNIILRLSGAILIPGDGFKQLYVDQTSDVSYSVLGNFVFNY
jgi:hypothetical protein